MSWFLPWPGHLRSAKIISCSISVVSIRETQPLRSEILQIILLQYDCLVYPTNHWAHSLRDDMDYANSWECPNDGCPSTLFIKNEWYIFANQARAQDQPVISRCRLSLQSFPCVLLKGIKEQGVTVFFVFSVTACHLGMDLAHWLFKIDYHIFIVLLDLSLGALIAV